MAAPYPDGVRIFSSLLLMLGALAVLTLGAIGVSASPAMAEAPCHEMSHSTPGQTPDQAPNSSGKAMKAMACCAACVAAPAVDPAGRFAPTISPARLSAPLVDLPAGRRLSPEPGPPRLLIA
ncbi:hypothetical protein [Brevundimonas sp.]|jgi:hypothetical protein|uniref:hypothetical protein n=1 Tax=Brevundimonas sp. TaxID=1871086 RepID=UPI0037C03F79